MTIGQRIAEKRKELGFSQEALGEKLLSNVILAEGQTLELVLYAELSNGLFVREVIGSWTVGADGDLIPS